MCRHAECAYCWPYCERVLIAQCEAMCREHELELDIARELELNPFEEVPVAHEDAFWLEVCDFGC